MGPSCFRGAAQAVNGNNAVRGVTHLVYGKKEIKRCLLCVQFDVLSIGFCQVQNEQTVQVLLS